MAKYTLDIDVNYKSVEDLRAELKALEADFETRSIGSKEFTELGAKVKATRNQIKDLEASFEGLDKEQRATALVDTFNGLTGAVGAVSSAFIAFGASSQEIENAEKKLLGVIGVVNGLRDVSNATVAANKLLGNSFKTAFTTASGAINTTKVALAGLGIGALILVVTQLADAFDLFGTKAAQNTKDAEVALEKYTQKVQLLANINEEQYKEQIKAAQLAGQTEEEVNALRLKLRKEQFDQIQAEGKKLTLAQTKERAELIKIEKGYVAEIDALEVGAFKNQQAKRKKAADDAAATAKAQAANEVKAVKDRTEAIRQLDEAQATEGLDAITTQYANNLSRIKEAQDEELKQLNLTEAAKVAIREKYAAQIQTNEINRVKDTEAFVKDAQQKAIDDAQKQADDLAAAKDKEFQDTLDSLNTFYTNELTTQKQALLNGEITQQQYDQNALVLQNEKNTALLTATQDYNQNTADANAALADSQIALSNKVKDTEKTNQEAIQSAKKATLDATSQILGSLAGLAKDGSDEAKAFGLAQIGVDTAIALTNAQASAFSPASPDNAVTGGAAGVAKYLTYAAIILSNVAKARAILKSGNTSGGSASGGASIPSAGGYSGPTQGFLGGIPQLPTSTTGGAGAGYGGAQQGGGRTGGVFKTYVLAGDVTSAQAADARINQRRQF